MGPMAMLIIFAAANAMFAWSASRRWKLLQIGRPANRLDHIDARLRGVWRYAFAQEKMDYYNPAGIAHKFIFFGFVILLFRTLILWGRGVYPPFDLFILSPESPLGSVYEFSKDIMATLVVFGVSVFFYYRLVEEAQAYVAELRGHPHPDDHRHDDDRGHDVRRRVVRPRVEGHVVLLGGVARRHRGPVQGHRDDHRAARRRAVDGRVVGVAEPHGQPLRVVLRGPLPRDPHLGGPRRLLDARDPAARLLEPPAALEAFPRHHGDSERLHAQPQARRPPRADGRERREADGEGRRGRRGGRPDVPPRGHRAHRPVLVEVDPRLLHVHRVRPLLGQLPGAPHRQNPQPQAPHARPPQPPLRREKSSSTPLGGRTRTAVERGREAARPPRRRRRAPPADSSAPPETATASKPINLVPDIIHPDVLWACTTLPRLRGAVPGADLVRRQDHRHAAKPGHGQRRVPARAGEAVPGHGDERQPVEPLAHGPRALGRRPRRSRR